MHQHVPRNIAQKNILANICSFIRIYEYERVNHGSVTKLKMFSGYFDFLSNNTGSLFRIEIEKKIMLRKFNALEQDRHGMKLFLEINYGFGNLLKGLM